MLRQLRLLDHTLVTIPATLAPLVVGERGAHLLLSRPRGRVATISTHDRAALARPATYNIGPWALSHPRSACETMVRARPALGGDESDLWCPSCGTDDPDLMALGWHRRAPWHTARLHCACAATWMPLAAAQALAPRPWSSHVRDRAYDGRVHL